MNASVKISKEYQTWQPELIEWREYQKTSRGAIYYPSIHSLQWHIRKYRQALIECGALIKLRGRDYIHVELFEKSIIDIGSAEAYRRLK